MRQLGFPTLFCNQLEIDWSGRIVNYHMRMQDPKRHAVAALKSLNFFTLAAGDSYNDTAMLGEARRRIFLLPSRASTERVSSVSGDAELWGAAGAISSSGPCGATRLSRRSRALVGEMSANSRLFVQSFAQNRNERVGNRLMLDFVRMPVQRPKVVRAELFSCFVDRRHIEEGDARFIRHFTDDAVDMLELQMKELRVVRYKQSDQ